MDIDDLTNAAMGLAMFDSYKTAMERNKKAAEAFEDSIRGNTPPEKSYHVILNGKTLGPYSLGEVCGLIATGDVTPETYVWKRGLSEWVSASSMPELSFKNSKTKEDGTEKQD